MEELCNMMWSCKLHMWRFTYTSHLDLLLLFFFFVMEAMLQLCNWPSRRRETNSRIFEISTGPCCIQRDSTNPARTQCGRRPTVRTRTKMSVHVPMSAHREAAIDHSNPSPDSACPCRVLFATAPDLRLFSSSACVSCQPVFMDRFEGLWF